MNNVVKERQQFMCTLERLWLLCCQSLTTWRYTETANPLTQLTLQIKSHQIASENTIIYDLLGITVQTKCASPCIIYLCVSDLFFIVPVTKAFSNENYLPDT